MDDRELLSMAAMAAGIEVTGIVADGIPHRFGGGYWNPLRDDGDALRLAVQLKIILDPDGSQYAAMDKRGSSYAHATALRDGKRYSEPHGDSAASAVRRAIVRAAANDKE